MEMITSANCHRRDMSKAKTMLTLVIEKSPKIPYMVKEQLESEPSAVDYEETVWLIIFIIISTSKNTISDESSLICVFPVHKDGYLKGHQRT